MEKHKHQKCFTAAGMTFSVQSEYPIQKKTFHPGFRLFETTGTGEITIEHLFSIPDRFDVFKKKQAVLSNPMWTVYDTQTHWIYKKHPDSPGTGRHPAFIEFTRDFSSCRVFSDFISPDEYARAQFKSLTLFGCDQFLISRLIAEQKGLLIHANAFVSNRRGYLLAGPSGAGKSTLTRMLEQEKLHIVSDDRIIVKMIKKEAVMHGSWFHGTIPRVTCGSYPLTAIFFLQKSGENKIIPINRSIDKFRHLLQAVVRPFLPADKWGFLLETVQALVASVPCFVLKFDLSGRIVDVLSTQISMIENEL